MWTPLVWVVAVSVKLYLVSLAATGMDVTRVDRRAE
jgi:hypothetical protein